MPGRVLQSVLMLACVSLPAAHPAFAGLAGRRAPPRHTSTDPMKCKVCRKAYEKAVAYVRENMRKVTGGGYAAKEAVQEICAWLFLADGRFKDDLEHCVKNAINCSQGYFGHFHPALAGFFLAEYYKYYPERRVFDAMQRIADYFSRTEERTGGWFKYFEGAYKKETSYPVVTHGFTMSLVMSFFYTAKVHGVKIPEETYTRGNESLLRITGSGGITYGDRRDGGRGWGEVTGGRGGVVIMGLAYAGMLDHKVFQMYKTLLPQLLPKMDQGHHWGGLHAMAVTLGCHVLGPAAYRKLTALWLNKLILKQDPDGGLYIGDDGSAGGERNLLGGNVSSTAAFALMIRLQDHTRLVPRNRGRNRRDGTLTVNTSLALERRKRKAEARAKVAEEREERMAAKKAAREAIKEEERAWGAKLLARVRAALAKTKEIRFRCRRMGGVTRLTAVDAKDRLKVSDRGGGISTSLPFKSLSLADKRSLALAVLRPGSLEAHRIAAFYCLAMGQKDKAEELLRDGGAGAEAVKAFFRKHGLPD